MGSLLYGSRWIIAGFATASILLLVIVVLSYRNTEQLVGQARMALHAHEVIHETGGLLTHVLTVESSARGYVVTANPDYLQLFEDGIRASVDSLHRLRQLTANDPAQQSRLEQLAPVLLRRLDVARDQVEITRTRGGEAGAVEVRKNVGLDLTTAVRTLIEQIQASEQNMLLLQQTAVESSVRRARLALSLLATLAVLLLGGIALGVRLSVGIQRSLREALERRAQRSESGLQRAGKEQDRLHNLLARSEVMAALGALVSGVAHEVRNPLFGISATLDAFEARYGAQEGFAPYLRALRRETERLKALMQDLLDYGRPQHFEPVAGRLGDAVAAAVSACRALAEQLGVQIVVENDDAGTLVAMDRPRLERAFENVLRNALQMSKRGGEVRVETRVLADAGRGWVECTIRDCGPGFAEEDLPKVFEPFFTRRSGGTGLGLPIVQRVLEQHGGSVTVGNHAQGGAVVVARLPVLAES